MIAGQLTHLAGELNPAVRQQDLGLTDPAGVEQNLPRSGVAGMVFKAETEVEIAERNPTRLPTPPHVDDAFAIRQQLAKPRAGFRCGRFFETSGELVWASGDIEQIGQSRTPWICGRTVVPPILPHSLGGFHLHPSRCSVPPGANPIGRKYEFAHPATPGRGRPRV